MTYARVDDLYDDKRKVKRAWRACPEAIGLHVLSITYCTRHRTDGVLPADWLEEILPHPARRDRVLRAMVEHELFDCNDGVFVVHDYLDWNDSAEVRSERSRAGKEFAARRWANGKRDG